MTKTVHKTLPGGGGGPGVWWAVVVGVQGVAWWVGRGFWGSRGLVGRGGGIQGVTGWVGRGGGDPGVGGQRWWGPGVGR